MSDKIPLTKRDLSEGLTLAAREIMDHVTKSFAAERLRSADESNKVHVELEAIKEMLAYRQEHRNLVRELKAQNIRLEDAKIFTS
jgi:hypothetical protein